jgi:hypothetical protein
VKEARGEQSKLLKSAPKRRSFGLPVIPNAAKQAALCHRSPDSAPVNVREQIDRPRSRLDQVSQ